jgi:hypothetical protein
MGFDLEGFTSAFDGDRARAYQFEWTWPPSLLTGFFSGINFSSPLDIKYLMKSTSFPESTVETLTHFYQGTEYKAAGSRRFSDWTVTLNCDPDSNIRVACEMWMSMAHAITGLGAGLPTTVPGIPFDIPTIDFQVQNPGEGLTGMDGYYTDQIFSMKEQDGGYAASVVLIDSWPKSIGPISLDYSSQEVASFDITFAYQYHMIIPVPVF